MEGKRDSFFLSNKKNKPDKHKQLKFKKQEKLKPFDEHRNGLGKDGSEQEGKKDDGKKPFDKKAYRLKKYSKKYKLEQWEEQRKKKLLHEYHKSIKNDAVSGTYKPKSFDEDVTDYNSEIGKFVRHPDLLEKEQSRKDKDPYKKAKEQYKKVKQEKIEKKEAMKKAKEERDQKLQEYKKKKQERFKKLSKKTKKGQPVMTGRLELLLEKIQSFK